MSYEFVMNFTLRFDKSMKRL